MIALLLACVEPPPMLEMPEWPMEQVTIRRSGLELALAAASVHEDGTGKGVEARAEVEGPPKLVVTGDRSEWDLRSGVVHFTGHVKALRGPVTLTCDALEVTYEEEHVREALATGTVVVRRDGRMATGDRALMTVATGRVELTGSPPRLQDGPNEMTGAIIVMFLDDERIECDACRMEVAADAVTPRGAVESPSAREE